MISSDLRWSVTVRILTADSSHLSVLRVYPDIATSYNSAGPLVSQGKMHLMYYLDAQGKRIYTLKVSHSFIS